MPQTRGRIVAEFDESRPDLWPLMAQAKLASSHLPLHPTQFRLHPFDLHIQFRHIMPLR